MNRAISRVVFCALFFSLSAVAFGSPRTLIERREPLNAVAVGDIDHDGTPDLVIAGEHEVWRYRLAGGQPQEVDHFRAAANDAIIHLDLFDIDHDGHEEVLVTSLPHDQEIVASFILTLAPDGHWKSFASRFPWYFRTVQTAGDGGNKEALWLVGQRKRPSQRFSGPVVRLQWDGKTWHPQETIALPRGTNIYGFQFISEDHDKQTFLIVHHDGQVQFWTRESGRWQLNERMPRRSSALRAVCPMTEQTPYEASNFEAAACLTAIPLPLGQGENMQWGWIAQAPALGGAVGRIPYWRNWELMVAGRDKGGPWESIMVTQGSGAVTDYTRAPTGELLVLLQESRDDPFGTPTKSRLIVLPQP